MTEMPSMPPDSELKQALYKLDNLQNGAPDSFLESHEFELLISHFEMEEKYAEGLQVAELGLNQYPFHGGLLVDKANLLLLLHRYEYAFELLNSSHLEAEFETNACLMKIEALLAMSREEEAEEYLRFALDLPYNDETIEMLFELADVYDSYEEFEFVFDCLHRVLFLEPNNEEALYKICFWTDYTGRYEESISIHKKIIEDFPFNELAWFNLGAAYQGIKLHEKAIDAYQYCIALDEHFEYAYRNMGDAYIRLRKYDVAIEMLQKVIEPGNAEAVILEAIGYCYDKLRKYSQARKYYKRASLQNADDSHIIYKIAVTYMSERNWSEAITNLTLACSMSKLQPDYNLALGQCYMQVENYADAITHLGVVVRTRPKNKAGWIELLECLYLAGMYEEGLSYAEFAFEQTDKKPVFLYFKSVFYFALGYSKEGVLLLDHAMMANPKLIKKFIELNPSLLHHKSVVDVVSKYRTKKYR